MKSHAVQQICFRWPSHKRAQSNCGVFKKAAEHSCWQLQPIKENTNHHAFTSQLLCTYPVSYFFDFSSLTLSLASHQKINLIPLAHFLDGNEPPTSRSMLFLQMRWYTFSENNFSICSILTMCPLTMCAGVFSLSSWWEISCALVISLLSLAGFQYPASIAGCFECLQKKKMKVPFLKCVEFSCFFFFSSLFWVCRCVWHEFCFMPAEVLLCLYLKVIASNRSLCTFQGWSCTWNSQAALRT